MSIGYIVCAAEDKIESVSLRLLLAIHFRDFRARNESAKRTELLLTNAKIRASLGYNIKTDDCNLWDLGLEHFRTSEYEWLDLTFA